MVNIINPFINAHKRGAHEQLEGQLGSLKIAIFKIISREIYWICSGNDFSLDINNPLHPKVVCLANNPLRIEMYGAVFSLYITRMLKVINHKNRHKSSLVFDELPTISFRGLDTLIATARGNRISTLPGIQTIDQLIRDYGQEQANAILTNIENVFAGQSVGETTRFIQNRMLFLPENLLSGILPVSFLPEKVAWHLFRLPWYPMLRVEMLSLPGVLVPVLPWNLNPNEIDKGISDLINLLWSADFITFYSYQEIDNGLMWIEFPQYYAEVFINVLCSEIDAQDPLLSRILGDSADNSWDYRLSLRNMSAFNKDVSENPVVSFRLSVRFPKEDYLIVLIPY